MGQPFTMGDLGGQVIDSSSGAITGKHFRGIQVLNDAVLGNFTAPSYTDADIIEGITLNAGTVILMSKGITEITVTSGVIYAFN